MPITSRPSQIQLGTSLAVIRFPPRNNRASEFAASDDQNDDAMRPIPVLGWFERLAALQAARPVAGCDQPAERTHP